MIESLVCAGCERSIERAHKLHRGAAFCNTCYSRLFKRRLCASCGMFRRLHVAEPQSACSDCEKQAPCVRCHRSGRRLGKITPYGPVCNSCREYFIEPGRCVQCGEQSRRLRKASDDEASGARICHRCAHDHHTCLACRKYRPCRATPDGRWVCLRCEGGATTPCKNCGTLIAAGIGARCERCYWMERCCSSADQLSHLVSHAASRNAFAEFVNWAVERTDPKRVQLSMSRHVEFFIELSKLGDSSWDGPSLLVHFGTQKLRQFELAVRWLGEARSLRFDEQQKIDSAEMRRFEAQLESIASGTPGAQTLTAFHAQLRSRRDAGEVSARTARMNFHPAANLMKQCADRVPSQADLDAYLRKAPGQRAALSAFLSFLRNEQLAELRMPAKSTRAGVTGRARLERQLRDLLTESPRPNDFQLRWRQVALMYFHRLPRPKAQSVSRDGVETREARGWLVEHGGQQYWIPDPSDSELAWSKSEEP